MSELRTARIITKYFVESLQLLLLHLVKSSLSHALEVKPEDAAAEPMVALMMVPPATPNKLS